MIRAGGSHGGQPASPDAAAEASSPGETSAQPQPDAARAGTDPASTDPASTDPASTDQASTGQAGQRAAAPRRPVRRALRLLRAAGRRTAAVLRRPFRYAWVRHVTLLLVYEGAGIAATWPRTTFLPDGTLPMTPDVASFVWNIWWTAHQLVHPGNPFFTSYMAAPTGTQLGFSTLMPLAGWLTAPITVLYGPSASFNLLAIITPGLLCYAMFRAARLWLNAPGAIVAGAFFGLSSMVLWQNWYHLNIAIGTIFLPVTIEAAVRFRRKPAAAAAVALGLALGASILVNQESTVVALILAAAILLPWIAMKLLRDRAALRRLALPLGIGAVVGLAVAAPELIAMAQQMAAGGASPPAGQLAVNYTQFGVPLPTLFAPSPRLATFGLGSLASAYSYNQSIEIAEAVPTFGAVLGGLALLGIIVGWRKRSTWAFLGLWLGGAVLALGTSLVVGSNCQFSAWRAPGTMWGRACRQYLPLLTHLSATRITPPGSPPAYRPVAVSNLMPYTWLVRVPGLAGLREADRFAIAGMIGAAMLAGMTVQWLSRRKVTMPLIALVVAAGALEAGWSGAGGTTMPTTLPAVDHPLSADHTRSIVVDVPFGLRGGLAATGSPSAPNALLLATHDGHPRAISYTAWVAAPTSRGMSAHAFFRVLTDIELAGQDATAGQVRLAGADLRRLGVGWVVEWRNIWKLHHPLARYGHVDTFLKAVGFVRVQRVCLVSARSIARCPSHPSQQVWLYRYEPGHS